MNQRPLQLFLHLSKSLSFAKTSTACHVTPSSLSRVIQRLESEVGRKLLERDSRRVKLTPAGEAFQRYAEQASEGWAAFKQEVQERTTQLRGELSLFCSVTASYSFLDEILGEFRAQHPGIEIKLHTGDSADTLERISAGREDMGIAALPEKIPDKFLIQLLSSTPLVFIAPLRNRLKIPELQAGASLVWEKMPLILSESGLVRERVDRWLKALRIKPSIYAQVSGHEAIVSMVGLGFGVGLVPQIVLENSPLAAKIRVVPVEHAMPPLDIGLCVLTRKLSNPLIAAFWELASQSIANKKL
jgi:LysR family transcriptional regulator, positive regulator for ilvC